MSLQVGRVAVTGLATTACVRVRDTAGEVVGSGFLVGTDLVATCAHVVAAALRSDPYDREPPTTAVTIDFPTVAGGPAQRSARVHRWVPIAEDGTGDVAVLRLAEPAPAGVVMPPLRRVELWDVPAGRRLGSTELVVQNANSVVADGDTLVAVTPDGSLQVRRLPDLEPVGPTDLHPRHVGPPRLRPGGTAGHRHQLRRWPGDRPLGPGEPDGGREERVLSSTVLDGSLSTRGGSGNLPEEIPLRPGDWTAHLCHLLPGEPSAGAVALLPAGAERSSPCGGPG